MPIIKTNSFILNSDTQEFMSQDTGYEEIKLADIPFKLLCYLIDNKNIDIDISKIITDLWNKDVDVNTLKNANMVLLKLKKIVPCLTLKNNVCHLKVSYHVHDL